PAAPCPERRRGLASSPPLGQCEVAGQRAATGATQRPGALFQPAPPERSMHLSAHYALRQATKSRPVMLPLVYPSVAVLAHREELALPGDHDPFPHCARGPVEVRKFADVVHLDGAFCTADRTLVRQQV